MKRRTLAPLRFVLAAVALAVGPSAQLTEPPGVNDGAGESIDLLRDVRIDQNLGALLPLDTVVRTHAGQEVPLGSLVGERPFVLTLVYYECPMLCTMTFEGLIEGLRMVPFDVGSDYDVVTLSIDPGEGSELASAKRANLIEAYGRPGSDVGWHVLTARQESIERIAAAVGFHYEYDPATDEYAHAAGAQLVTPDGRISRYFYGLDLPPRDVRLGLVEAGEGKIGTLADAALLWCYQYDPATGRYGLVIFSSIRLLGLATVVAIATFVIRHLRRDRRLRSAEALQQA